VEYAFIVADPPAGGRDPEPLEESSVQYGWDVSSPHGVQSKSEQSISLIRPVVFVVMVAVPLLDELVTGIVDPEEVLLATTQMGVTTGVEPVVLLSVSVPVELLHTNEES